MPTSKLEINRVELSGYVGNKDVKPMVTANGRNYCWVTLIQPVLVKDSALSPYRQRSVTFNVMCVGDACSFAVKRLHRGCRVVVFGKIDTFIQIYPDGTKHKRQILEITEIYGFKLIEPDKNEEKLLKDFEDGKPMDVSVNAKTYRQKLAEKQFFQQNNIVAEVTGEESETK